MPRHVNPIKRRDDFFRGTFNSDCINRVELN